MYEIEKIAEINRLLDEIKWPDNTDIYFTVTRYRGRITGTVYISPGDKEGKTHKEGCFGDYFKQIYDSLDVCIEKLKEHLNGA